MQRQLAVRGHELEAPIRTRHRTHRDEAPPRAPRQPLEQRRPECLSRGAVPGVGRRPQRLAGRAVTDEGPRPSGRGVRAHQATVETHLVVGSDARPERRSAAVDGEPAGADPDFRLAPRGEPGTRQHLLQPLGERLHRRARRNRATRAAGSSATRGGRGPRCAPHQPSRSRGPATSSREPPPSADSSSSSGFSSSASPSWRFTSEIALSSASGGSSSRLFRPK